MAKLVYAYLVSHEGPGREIRPSYERIAKDINTSRSTARRMVHILKQHGLIDWRLRKGGKENEANVYRLLPLPVPDAQDPGRTDPAPRSQRHGTQVTLTRDPGHSDPEARHSYQDLASSKPQDALSQYEALPPNHKQAFGRMLKATNIDGLARHLAKTGELQDRLDTFSKELAKQEYIEQGGSAWGYEHGHVDVFSWTPSPRVIADLQEFKIGYGTPQYENILKAFRGKHGEPPFRKNAPHIWESHFRIFLGDHADEYAPSATKKN